MYVNILSRGLELLKGTNLFGFIEGSYIVDETNKGYSTPDNVYGRMSFLFWNDDGAQYNNIVVISPFDALWGIVNLFECQENFRCI